jgi:hypothetical protein
METMVLYTRNNKNEIIEFGEGKIRETGCACCNYLIIRNKEKELYLNPGDFLTKEIEFDKYGNKNIIFKILSIKEFQQKMNIKY